MSIMSKIRERFTLVAAVIFISLLSFVLIEYLKNIGKGGGRNAGEIAGQTITGQDLQMKVQELEQRYNADNADMRWQINDQAWQSLMYEILLAREYGSAGIEVTGDELVQMFLGPNMSPMVRQQQSFMDSLGRIDTVKIRQFLDIAANPTNEPNQIQVANYIAGLERDLTNNRQFEKWSNLIKGSVFTASNAVARAYDDENKIANFQMLAVNYMSIPDSAVKVTEAELKDYYNRNLNRFKQKELNVIARYVSFKKTPSSVDSSNVKKNVEKLIPSFKGTKQELWDMVSDIKGDTSYRSPDMMQEPLGSMVVENDTANNVLGPYFSAGHFKIARVVGKQKVEEPMFKGKHILVRIQGFSKEDTAKSRTEAAALKAKLNKDNFVEMALKESDDPSVMTTNADLPNWISKNDPRMGPKFYESFKNAGKNDIVIAEGTDGIHIVLVTHKCESKYQLAEISREVAITDSTESEIYQKASNFLTLVTSLGSIDSAARKFKEAPVLLNSTNPYLAPGSGKLSETDKGSRNVVAWALSSEEGEIVSEPMTTDEAIIVAQVISRVEEGTKPFDMVKDQFRAEVIKEVKAKMIREKLEKVPKGDIETMTKAYGDGAVTKPNLTAKFSDPNLPLAGEDNILMGKIFSMKQGERSPIIVGNTGVFIVQMDGYTAFNPLAAEEYKPRQASMATSQRDPLIQKYIAALKEIGHVRDTRYELEYQKR